MAFPGMIPSMLPMTKTDNIRHIIQKRSQLHNSLKAYTLRDKLGEGGYGSVYLADTYVKSNLTSFALKTVPWSRLTKPHHCGQYKMEVETLLALADTGSMYFPQVRECFADDHNLYLVTDYLRGGSLRDEIDRAPMSPDRIKFVAAQLVVALSQMRDARVIHRDIKPGNIMFDALGNVTLIDFGLCAIFNQDEGAVPALEQDSDSDESRQGDIARTRCGTLQYIAPEVVRKVPYSYEVDVWSFGVVLYEMIFNNRPFASNDCVLQRILTKNWRRPRGHIINPVVVDLLDKILEKDPVKRATLEEIKAHPFFEGVDWDAVASRSYVLPESYAPVLDFKPNRIGFIDIVDLLDPKEAETTKLMKEIKPEFLEMYRVKKTETKAPIARPANPRRFTSKVKKALSSAFAFARRYVPTDKIWPVSDNVYVLPHPDFDPVAIEAGRDRNVPPETATASAYYLPTPQPQPASSLEAIPVEFDFSEFNYSIESVHVYDGLSTAAPPQDHPARPALLNTGIGLGIIIPQAPPSLAASTATTPSSAGPVTPVRSYLQESTAAGSIYVSEEKNADVKSPVFSEPLAAPKPLRA